MGMLPIFLAGFGFVMLWSIVNYYTLAGLRNKANLLSNQLAKSDNMAQPSSSLSLQKQELQSYKRSYNKLISKKPTWFLAKIFGFKPI